MAKLESRFQSELIKELRDSYPKSVILKPDPQQTQGIPDLLILEGDRWAMLECKRRRGSSHRPNQDYYVNKLNNMSFAAFIDPSNKQEVLSDLEQALRPRRNSRVSKRKQASLD